MYGPVQVGSIPPAGSARLRVVCGDNGTAGERFAHTLQLFTQITNIAGFFRARQCQFSWEWLELMSARASKRVAIELRTAIFLLLVYSSLFRTQAARAA